MKRLLRFLIMESLICVARLTHSFRNPGIPIFVYHSIDTSGQSISLTPKVFEQQLDYLRQHKFSLLGAEQAVQMIKKKQRTGKCVVLSFDDAYKSIKPWTEDLSQKGDCATIFIPSQCIGLSNIWDKDRKDISQIPIMDSDQLKRLSQMGIEMGAHTQTHPRLTEIPPTDLARELNEVRGDLLNSLALTPQTIAYPYGEFNQDVLDATRKADYLAGFTTQLGYFSETSDLFAIPRFPSNIDHQLFRLIVHGGYGWYQKMQKMVFGS